ncbi:hypothetical protein ACOSLZ_000368 [Acinetobacter baumannii]|uniref:hypothetical protein n=1 Tax=Acinetobacter baumannii TaxID=470 RepID=UPI0015805043|nr:hypothetical protein [Acinetobacter baumannii]NUF17630.1 hypothetical protein [Acinetobacter baumannii]
MYTQNDIQAYYEHLKNIDNSELNHPLYQTSNIYFHGTSLENYNKIKTSGFKKESSQFQACFFNKSIRISQQYAISKSVTSPVLIAVNLDFIFGNEEFKEKFLLKDTDLKIFSDIPADKIIHVIYL